MKTNYKKIAVDGVITSNPTFKLVLGTCPTLALTTLAMNGIGMGAAVTFVLICSNVFVSLLRNVIPDKVRIPAFVLIIATFVTIVRLVLDKFLPMSHLTRASVCICRSSWSTASYSRGRKALPAKTACSASAADGLFMGIGFTLALTLMGAFREILGAGAFSASSFGISR